LTFDMADEQCPSETQVADPLAPDDGEQILGCRLEPGHEGRHEASIITPEGPDPVYWD
jgi:hypothetical protein